MLISRNYKAEDWKELTFKTEEDWWKAAAISWDRMETRYLEHIRRILGHHTLFAAISSSSVNHQKVLPLRHSGRESAGQQRNTRAYCLRA
jgi:hypothetical protein